MYYTWVAAFARAKSYGIFEQIVCLIVGSRDVDIILIVDIIVVYSEKSYFNCGSFSCLHM